MNTVGVEGEIQRRDSIIADHVCILIKGKRKDIHADNCKVEFDKHGYLAYYSDTSVFCVSYSENRSQIVFKGEIIFDNTEQL